MATLYFTQQTLLFFGRLDAPQIEYHLVIG